MRSGEAAIVKHIYETNTFHHLFRNFIQLNLLKLAIQKDHSLYASLIALINCQFINIPQWEDIGLSLSKMYLKFSRDQMYLSRIL